MTHPRPIEVANRRRTVVDMARPAGRDRRLSSGREPTSNGGRDDHFAEELLALIPFMRAVARGLTPERAEADDIVQEALLKAWAKRDSYQMGTSMRAWTATIVRNYYRETRRRSWRLNQLDEHAAEQLLVANDDPAARLELDDVRRAIYLLPLIHREVLMLLAGGLTYEQVAQVCACAEGTVKSRANRARKALQAQVDVGRPAHDAVKPAQAMDTLIHDIRVASARGQPREPLSA